MQCSQGVRKSLVYCKVKTTVSGQFCRRFLKAVAIVHIGGEESICLTLTLMGAFPKDGTQL